MMRNVLSMIEPLKIVSKIWHRERYEHVEVRNFDAGPELWDAGRIGNCQNGPKLN